MADEGTLQGSTSDGLSDLIDILHQHVRVNAGIRPRSDALGRFAIQVLAADRDAVNDAGEISSVLPDSSLQSGDLVGEGSVTGRCPETQQERGPGLDGSRDGGDGITGGTGLDHGIESGAGPTLCALEIGGCGELGLKIGLSLGSSRGEG